MPLFKKHYLSALFLILITLLMEAQTPSKNKILDGIYIKENTPTRQVRMSRANHHYGNTDFYIRQARFGGSTDSGEALLNCEHELLKLALEKPPIKMDDCVYFNPAKRYICQFDAEDENHQYFYLNRNAYKTSEAFNPSVLLPNSMRFYIDPEQVKTYKGEIEFEIQDGFDVPFETYFQSFYFRKFEVSNKEYREFVYWVRDSIARLILIKAGKIEYGSINKEQGSANKAILNWETEIYWKNYELRKILDSLYLPKEESFYRKEQINTNKIQYKFKRKDLNKKSLPVYPDTLVWIHDFQYSFNEVMTNMYFWHPAYDDYPVVGISYYQALAFLEWKSIRHRKELKEKNSPYTIEYRLPSEAQWDMASTSSPSNDGPVVYGEIYSHLSDETWITDLHLQQRKLIVKTDTIEREDFYIKTYLDSGILATDTIFYTETKYVPHERYEMVSQLLMENLDEVMHTSMCDINKIKERNEFINSNLDDFGICFMGGNVSEWVDESYDGSYGKLFEMRQNQLKSMKSEDSDFQRIKEEYYNSRNDTNGMLVRGSNWFDERYGNIYNKNKEGIIPKLFVHPNRSHSTLGFRYVIIVKRR